jgi:hypothetical protein
LAIAVEIAGLGLLAAAIGWWALVYLQVYLNTGFTLLRATPCLLLTSDTCSLAMSLCGGHHLFGIVRYSETLLWAGLATSVLAGALRLTARRA